MISQIITRGIGGSSSFISRGLFGSSAEIRLLLASTCDIIINVSTSNLSRLIQFVTSVDITINIDSTTGINIVSIAERKTTIDLQYWFSKFIQDNAIIGKYQTSYTSMIEELYDQNSFIELLFNDNYSSSNYVYLYRNNTDRTTWPEGVKNRLLIHPSTAEYYMCDSTALCDINLYNLTSIDFTLLNRLLTYRLTPSSATLTGIIYENLTTNFSKLIFIYLDAVINNSITNYNHGALLSSDGELLESCYEVYVIENVFIVVSARDKT